MGRGDPGAGQRSPLGDGCKGGVLGASPRPPASRLGWVMEKPWEMPAAGARAPCSCRNPHGPAASRGPAPPSRPIRGEALARPADIPALPACRAGRSCEATPGSSLSAPRPFAPSTAGLPAPLLASQCRQGGGHGAKPTGAPRVTALRSPESRQRRQPPAPQKRDCDASAPTVPPLPPFSSLERVICILYVKEILLSPSPSPSLFW